jgi:hypothetical protein
MKKNCINCKYNIPVTGADYGFCNHKGHLGRIASEHTLCSEYEVQEESTYTNEEIQEILLGIKCCTDKSKGCSACPFARYEYVCQQYLMSAAGAVIEKLQRELSGYIVDQSIWLTRNDYLEKENKSLWNSYHKGYAVGYEYGKQDALSAERAEPVESRPEITKSDIDSQEIAAVAMNRFRNQLHLAGVLDLHKNGDKVLEERNYILERYYGGVPKELKDLSI